MKTRACLGKGCMTQQVGRQMAFMDSRGYRNGYPFHEDWNCTWSDGYPFAEAANHPRGNGYVPGSQHRPRNRYATYTDCRFPKSITQLGVP